MKFKQPPLKVYCNGLRLFQIYNLFNELSLHFREVKIWGEDEIFAETPHDDFHYGKAWRVLDKFKVKVV